MPTISILGGSAGYGTIAKVVCDRVPTAVNDTSPRTGRPLIRPGHVKLTLLGEEGEWISDISMDEEEYEVLRRFFAEEESE